MWIPMVLTATSAVSATPATATTAALSVNRASQPARPGDRMLVTAGNDVGWQVISPEEAMKTFKEKGALRCGPDKARAHWEAHGPLYAKHGVTAFEPYVKWMLMEPEKGVWDPSFYDAELALFKEHGLKWVPFLIAGPAYATPPWFKESDESVFAVDLATGDVSRDQSIWNPHLKPRVRAWLQRFFDHYDHDQIQAALLGVSGVFGESIYTAGGNVWTQIWDGKYPQHLGWWCGDEHAEADFRRKMQKKYGKIGRLNRAWDADYRSFEEVKPFIPKGSRSRRSRLDFVRWYMGSMTDFAEWWVATSRELAPTVPILLCTGGSAQAELGADMSAQSKMVSKHGAGIRITNEASNYTTNFAITRMVGSACLHYDTYFGYEPAGAVDENGIVARVYNAAASGAWELFHYDNPPQGERGMRYVANLNFLELRKPIVPVGFFWSRVSVDLKEAQGLYPACAKLRDVSDLAFVDELLIQDGALDKLWVLVWPTGRVTEKETAERIEDAVRKGLVLLVPEDWNPISPEERALFPSGVREGSLDKGTVVHAESPSPQSLAASLREILRNEAYDLPEDASLHALAEDLDGVFQTVTKTDFLFLNHTDVAHILDSPWGPIDLPPQGIASLPMK